MKLTISCFAFVFALIHLACGQDIYFTPYGKINAGLSAVDKISFSQDAGLLSATDSKGNLALIDINQQQVTKTLSASGKVIFHEFLNTDNSLLVVRSSGALSQYKTPDLEKTPRSQSFIPPNYVTLDPNQGYLTLLGKDGKIEIFDLRSNMSQARIQPPGDMKNTLFLGFDRFGQQIASINNIGETYNWEFLNQKFLRQLKLQSGEYSGSRSVIHAAATNSGSDNFVISLQEVFIPKGGIRGGQPERKNMLIAFDWVTGQEKKRVPLRYRADGLAMGPTPAIVTYYSEDSRTIFIVNLDKGEVRGSVSVDEKPTTIALADNGEFLAVGTSEGIIYLYEVIRNNPAEIKIINPGLNRNIGEQVVTSALLPVEGKIEGQDKITQVMINGSPAELNFDGSFKSNINLVPGKNRVRVSAQNTQSQVIHKDIYLTLQPSADKPQTEKLISAQRRVALIIGNADYMFSSKLINTSNDAKSMSETLKLLGFEVMMVENGSYENMKNAIYAFGDRIQEADVSVFFYAGHGLEVDGMNYLVPVDANIQSHLDIKQRCIPLSGVLGTMEFANDEGLNMIILDACRNNPFPAGKRGGAGLARVNAPSGTLIAYATDPGSVASDGDGTNGLYTGELIKQLKVSQRIEDVFMNTRNSVEKISKGQQRPWEEARLKGVFYLK